jgi:hypothetical protein
MPIYRVLICDRVLICEHEIQTYDPGGFGRCGTSAPGCQPITLSCTRLAAPAAVANRGWEQSLIRGFIELRMGVIRKSDPKLGKYASSEESLK